MRNLVCQRVSGREVGLDRDHTTFIDPRDCPHSICGGVAHKISDRHETRGGWNFQIGEIGKGAIFVRETHTDLERAIHIIRPVIGHLDALRQQSHRLAKKADICAKSSGLNAINIDRKLHSRKRPGIGNIRKATNGGHRPPHSLNRFALLIAILRQQLQANRLAGRGPPGICQHLHVYARNIGHIPTDLFCNINGFAAFIPIYELKLQGANRLVIAAPCTEHRARIERCDLIIPQ